MAFRDEAKRKKIVDMMWLLKSKSKPELRGSLFIHSQPQGSIVSPSYLLPVTWPGPTLAFHWFTCTLDHKNWIFSFILLYNKVLTTPDTALPCFCHIPQKLCKAPPSHVYSLFLIFSSYTYAYICFVCVCLVGSFNWIFERMISNSCFVLLSLL